MPDRRFVPPHEPPALSERLRAHPHGLTQAVAAVAVGVLLVVDAVTPSAWAASLPLVGLAAWVLVGMGVLLGVGGVMVTAGLLSAPRRRAWMLERSGLWLCVPGWLSYATASTLGAAYPVGPIVTALLAVGGAVRLWTLATLEAEARRGAR